jgi:hypothetical protein
MAVAPVTRALNARAELHLKRGDVAAARADAQRALEIARKLQNTKQYSSLTGASLLQLAEIEAAAGDQAKGRKFAKDAEHHLRRSLGAEHPETVRAARLAG